MTSTLIQWATRHRVSYEALQELQAIFRLNGEDVIPHSGGPFSEAYVQSQVRIEAGRKGLRLWRNNVGALQDSRGVPVRYGLGNDSPQLNKVIKSGDLIGWRPVVIGGVKIAQFVSRECKRPGWRYTGTEREIAQLKWAETLIADGGDASFATGAGTL